MSKKLWVKWSLLFATSAVAVFGFGGCVADFLMMNFILRGVN